MVTLSDSAVTNISYIGLVFYTGLLLSLLLVPLSSRLAFWLGALDIPDERKVHQKAVPRLGGVAVAFSMMLTVLLCIPLEKMVQAYLLGGFLIVFTGLLDDKYQISPKLKFAGQILAVLVFLKISGVLLPGLGNLLGTGEINFGFLALPLTVFAMVGVINALNLSDGLDGLAAGICLIALVFLAQLSFLQQDWLWLTIIAAFLGALLGFLRYNTYPAQLFMGDTGSLLLGYTMAAISVGLVQNNGAERVVQPVTIFLTLALPIIDTLLVMGRRVLKGTSPFQPDKTHLHHRLMSLGLSHVVAVSLIYGCAALLGLSAWMLRQWPEWLQFYLVMGGLATGYGLLTILEKHEVNLSSKIHHRRPSPATTRRKLVRVSGKSVPLVGWLLPILLFAPLLILWKTPLQSGLLTGGGLLFVGLLFPWWGGRKQMGLAHGVMFGACFLLLIFYHFHPRVTPVIIMYLNSISIVALLWVGLRVMFKRRDQILLPSSFELLLMIISWFVPMVLARGVGLSEDCQQHLFLVCFQAIPLLIAIKLTLRRHARRNKQLAFAFLLIFLLLTTQAVTPIPLFRDALTAVSFVRAF